jgi:hypothetical protein
VKYGESADPTTQLKGKIVGIRKDLDETRKPKASQIYQQLEEVRTLVVNLEDRVDTLISDQSYTKQQIDDKDNALGGRIDGKANASHGHDQSQISGTWDKSVATAGSGQFNAGVTSVGVYNLQLTSSYKVMYVDSNGRMGFAPSSRRFKQQVGAADFTDDQIVQIQVVYFQYLAEIAKRDDPTAPGYIGPNYHVGTKLGVYAEDFHALGLWPYVIYQADDTGLRALLNPDGSPIPVGIRYEMLGMLLIPAVQRLIWAKKALDGRVTTLEKAASSRLRQKQTTTLNAFTIAANRQEIPITWATPFVDADYDVAPEVQPSTTGILAVTVTAVKPGTQTAKGCTVIVQTTGVAAVAAGQVLSVVATHL